MKMRIVTVAVLSLTAGAALAQRPEGPPGPPPVQIERLAVILDLDAGQKVEVEKILNAQREDMKAQREKSKESGTRPSREDMKKSFEASQQKTLDSLRPVLSDVQLRKFEALTERPKGERPAGKRRDKNDSSGTTAN